MSLDVIGAGFGRTGTLSLKAALEQLGFSKCHHMFEVGTHPEQAEAWHAISRGQRPNWDRVFEGYRASCDFPSSIFWEELHEHFPDSKVVLTVRDPDRWYDSVAETIYPISHGLPRWMRFVSPRLGRIMQMVDTLVWSQLFDGRFEEREHALQVFHENSERARKVVAPDRLLVFEARDGWEPLCAFLGVPVPDTPFPHLNEGAGMQRMRRMVTALRWAPWVLLAALGVGLLFLI